MDGTSVRSGLAQNSANQSVVQPAADSCSSRAARSVAVMSVLRIAGADGDRLVGFGVRWPFSVRWAARPGTGGSPYPGGLRFGEGVMVGWRQGAGPGRSR